MSSTTSAQFDVNAAGNHSEPSSRAGGDARCRFEAEEKEKTRLLIRECRELFERNRQTLEEFEKKKRRVQKTTRRVFETVRRVRQTARRERQTARREQQTARREYENQRCHRQAHQSRNGPVQSLPHRETETTTSSAGNGSRRMW